MKMKMKNGICHICLEVKKLSYEHFPPKTCFNNEKVIIGDKISQKGVGDYTLCEQCNNNTGAWYVPEYEKLIKAIAYVLCKDKNKFDSDSSISGLSLKVKDINPLLCTKQMLVIMCSLMPVEILRELKLSEFLSTEFAFLDGTENFELLVGVGIDNENGNIFKGPILIPGNIHAFCLHMYPLKIALILEKGYKIPGYTNFNVFLESDIRKSGEYVFNIDYLKDDLFCYIANIL